jgi:hypothetical protein
MHAASTGRMQCPPAVAFDNLGPLILGHHAWDLEEELVFRAAAQLAVEEHHLDAHPLAFIHEEDLISVCTCQPIRRVDIQAIDGAGGDDIAEALQGGPHSRGAPVALIQTLHRLWQDKPIQGHAFP